MNPKPAFDFLARPPRATKPRKAGLTVTSDKAKSLADTGSLIETAGDIVDHMKIPDHVGVIWRYSAALLKKKNALYAKAGIEAMRHGPHRAADYSYFHAWRGKQVPRIPAP